MHINLPNTVKDLEPAIKTFVEAMIYKLHKNAHKGKWEDMTVDTSLTRLHEEICELAQAIDEGNGIETILEAADVANFAMIIANIAIKEAGK
jgi:NTP pyrophosphatase (non-canonical NTP hydrolase)